MGFHKNMVGLDNHIPHTYEYANDVARLAAVGFLAEDVGKWAFQQDTKVYWRLDNHSPITWIEASNISRWSLTDVVTGELTYNGLEPFAGTVFAQLSVTAASGSPEYRFRAVKNGLVLTDDIETVVEAGSALISSVSLIAPVCVVNGDTIRLQVKNVDNINNITISHLSVSIQ